MRCQHEVEKEAHEGRGAQAGDGCACANALECVFAVLHVLKLLSVRLDELVDGGHKLSVASKPRHPVKDVVWTHTSAAQRTEVLGTAAGECGLVAARVNSTQPQWTRTRVSQLVHAPPLDLCHLFHGRRHGLLVFVGHGAAINVSTRTRRTAQVRWSEAILAIHSHNNPNERRVAASMGKKSGVLP